jgi:hypothetical protein
LVPRRPSVPSRVYDVLNGGYHHDEADAAFADKLAEIYSGVRRLIADNRAYLARAVPLAFSRLGISVASLARYARPSVEALALRQERKDPARRR